jgi:outer membrane protein assembly factor BamE
MRALLSVIVISLVLLLSHCASYDFSRRIVEQGNMLSFNKIKRLRIGMSKDEVAALFGTSLLSPTFTTQRWDYAYTLRKGSGYLTIRYVTLYFAGNRLARIEQKL